MRTKAFGLPSASQYPIGPRRAIGNNDGRWGKGAGLGRTFQVRNCHQTEFSDPSAVTVAIMQDHKIVRRTIVSVGNRRPWLTAHKEGKITSAICTIRGNTTL